MSDSTLSKRKRDRNSPETIQLQSKKQQIMPMEGNVSTLSVSALKELVREVIQSEIGSLATKQDLQAIVADVEQLKSDCEKLKNSVKNISTRDEQLTVRLEYLEKRTKQTNLIITGWETIADDPHNAIQKLCRDVLSITSEVHINKTRVIGRNNNKPTLLVEFDSALLVQLILKKTKNLQGTKISIRRDLTFAAREGRKKLLEIKRCLGRFDANKKVIVRDDSMWINNIRFSWKNNCLMQGNQEGLQALNEILDSNFTSTEEIFKLKYESVQKL